MRNASECESVGYGIWTALTSDVNRVKVCMSHNICTLLMRLLLGIRTSTLV